MPGHAVAFIVPIHNRWDLAEPTLRALVETTRHVSNPSYLVIDDGCSEAVSTAIAALPAPFRNLRNARNEGFGASVNRAMRAIAQPLAVLVNSDLVLSAGWLEPMLAVMDAEPDAFAVGNIQTAVADGAIDHAGIVFHQEGYPIHFRADRAFIESRSHREFPAVTAACVLVRRERFLELGGFDERYRNGFEDVDLCLRARTRGWPSFVSNLSRVGHHISASPGRGDHEASNARKFLERWRPLTAVWQRDWENRLLHERRSNAGEMPDAARPPHRAAPASNRLRVLVDLARLEPGGANGGIKMVIRGIFPRIRAAAPEEFAFLLVVPSPVVPEVLAWIGDHDEVWALPSSTPAPVSGDRRVRELHTADASLARLLDADVIYSPLGVTDYLTPDVPVIGMAVDILHREHPECLPAPDVTAREAWFDRMVCTSARIHCLSHWVAACLQRDFGPIAAPGFVDHPIVHARLGTRTQPPPGTRPVFLYPANAWPHKNHDTLLVAYRLYLESGVTDPWPLVLTGHPDAAMRRVEAHARALGIAPHVHIRGFLDDKAFLELWSGAGAMVFTSLYEGFGIPLVEAMQFGIPIVAGAVASIPEVAGDAYLAADVRDPRSLAAALTRISTDGELRSNLIEQGYRRASELGSTGKPPELAGALRQAVRGFRRAGITWHWEAATGHARRV